MPPRWRRARPTMANRVVRLLYDPRYYAGNVFDPDGYSLEFDFKSWQHPQPPDRYMILKGLDQRMRCTGR